MMAGIEQAEQIVGERAPPGAPAVVDRAVLEQLSDLIGRAKTAELVSLFETGLAERLPIVIGATTPDMLRGTAHDLVSMAGNLGFVELSQVSRRFTRGGAQMAPSATARPEELRAAVERAAAAASAWLAEIDGLGN